MIFTIIGILGLIFIIIGVLLQKNRKIENIFFLIGGILMLVYSIYLENTIFIILQAIFSLSAIWELIKINKN
ncbi:MAG TPA: hypothetical protein VMW82_01375 [Candidatus Paceibacterota bacterium]|nr:hypothetical protein [Candidatus Paceibacterota bacterium]